jgi:hypothetical protein
VDVWRFVRPDDARAYLAEILTRHRALEGMP